MATSIYVGQLSYEATEEDIARVFEDNNFEYERISVPQNHEKGSGKGFAFVDMQSADDVQKALDKIGNVEICGRPVSMREKNADKGKGKGKDDRRGRDDDRRGGGRYDDRGDEGKGKRGGKRQRSDPGECYDYRDEGNCRFGDSCRFTHDGEVGKGARKGKGPCYDFRDSGDCRFGDNCVFSH